MTTGREFLEYHKRLFLRILLQDMLIHSAVFMIAFAVVGSLYAASLMLR